jgi:hypothetical protein
MPFLCSICGEESTRICARCTKDACDNHLCEKCLRCSDCCECEVHLNAPEPVRTATVVETLPDETPLEAIEPEGADNDDDAEPEDLPAPEPDPAEVPPLESAPSEPEGYLPV